MSGRRSDPGELRTNRKVAVLGGTGWVGRHACATFAQRGYDVVAIARNEVPHIPSHCFVPFDLAAAPTHAIAALLRSERVDVVVNTIDSLNTTDGWNRTDEEHLQVNVAMVQRLLAAAGSLPWRIRLVHLGTILEYGPVPTGTAIAEAWPASPANAYARSKLAGSQAVLGSDQADGVVLRLVNLCGPHPAPDTFPGKLIRLLRRGGTTVQATEAKRDFLDVRDAAEAVVRAAEAKVDGRIFNIGSGQPVEIRDVVRMLITEAGLAGVTIQHRHVHSFGGEWTKADITLANRLLGWQPRISLRESLKDMWQAR